MLKFLNPQRTSALFNATTVFLDSPENWESIADTPTREAVLAWLAADNTPQPADALPGTSFSEQKAEEFTKFRADRELFLNRLAGIGVAAQFNSQTAVVASVVSVRQALLDMTSDPDVVAATDLASLNAAMKARYTTIVSGADPALYSAFRQVDL